jgi:hypothetical protein
MSVVNPKLHTDYNRFFDTHVKPGLLEDTRVVSLDDVKAFLKGGEPTFPMSQVAQQALKDHADIVLKFAEKVGTNQLLFEPDGTWFVPPKMRPGVPEYAQYLDKNYDGGKLAGTVMISFVENNPVPSFSKTEIDPETGKFKQIGGWEFGDPHGHLFVIDHRVGPTKEMYQTFAERETTKSRYDLSFVEKSSDAAFRSGMVAHNPAHPFEKVDAMLKSRDTKLDAPDMPTGRYVQWASFQQEAISSPKDWFNWDGGNDDPQNAGSQFSYRPTAGVEVAANSQRLSVIQKDMRIGINEGMIMSADGDPKKKPSDPGFVPMVRESFFLDGKTPRYVIETKEGFRNIAPDPVDGSVPEGAIRCKEYVQRIPSEKWEDWQVLKPYNHHAYAGTHNCFSGAVALLQGVAINGSFDDNLMLDLGAKNAGEKQISAMITRHLTSSGALLPGGRRTVKVDGPVPGNIHVFQSQTKSGVPLTIYDWCDMKAMAMSGDFENVQGLAAVMNQRLAAQREKVLADAVRPDIADLLLFDTHTISSAIADVHEEVYNPSPMARLQAAAAQRLAQSKNFQRVAKVTIDGIERFRNSDGWKRAKETGRGLRDDAQERWRKTVAMIPTDRLRRLQANISHLQGQSTATVLGWLATATEAAQAQKLASQARKASRKERKMMAGRFGDTDARDARHAREAEMLRLRGHRVGQKQRPVGGYGAHAISHSNRDPR